jgi:hypothetical protein
LGFESFGGSRGQAAARWQVSSRTRKPAVAGNGDVGVWQKGIEIQRNNWTMVSTVPYILEKLKVMPETTNQAEWKEKTNAIYQDGMKTLLNLATASLVLPIVLVKTFAVGGAPRDHLNRRAYAAWFFLFLSVFACLVFFYMSAKFLKVISGGKEAWTESRYETLRDSAIILSVASFLIGLFCCFLFLRALVATSTRSLGSSESGG